MKGSCVILQSGGPTSVINSSLYGVIEQAKKHPEIENIYGSLNGIDGILDDNLIDLNLEDPAELKYLTNTPGAILGSSRHRLGNDTTSEDYAKILHCFQKHNIRYFFLIGGNDSMDTGNKVHHYFSKCNYTCRVIGVPKTVDNDLVITDHTPGYGSALKYIANVFAEIHADLLAYKKGKVTIVEVMGRDAGWLTAGSKLASVIDASPDLIYLPETAFEVDAFLADLATVYQSKKRAVVAISEGIRDKDGKYIFSAFENNGSVDAFGHVQLGGAAAVLCKIVESKLNLPTRAVELNLPQRCASHIASQTDVKEAVACGKKAVKLAIAGKSGFMVVMKRASNAPYKITYGAAKLQEIANKVKAFPMEWIKDHDIADEFVDYALPLIKGENKNACPNGLPRFAKLKRVKVK